MNKTFEQIKFDLLGAINQRKIYQLFPSGYADYCGRAIPAIVEVLDKAETNPIISPQLVSDTVAILQDSLNYLILENNTEARIGFMNDMVLLVFNFNQLVKSQEITTLVQSIQKFTEFKNSTDALITASKRLVERMDLIYRRNPSFYKLSEHYLRELNASLK